MEFGDELTIRLKKFQDLRYGENPHLTGAIYAIDRPNFVQHGGKEISYNNMLDIDAAMDIADEFEKPFCAILKHTNPCGAACCGNLVDAYKKALATDPVSSFGGIVSANKSLDMGTAKEIVKTFTEVVVAPGYEKGVVDFLNGEKENLRLIERKKAKGEWISTNFQKAGSFVLVGDKDLPYKPEFEAVTNKKPSPDQLRDLEFAWKVCKHVKSNAIVTAKNLETVGIGPGQQSRNYSVKICGDKIFKKVSDPVLASDAFFPFRDGIDEAHKIGVTAIAQPGGSVRDDEVIGACDELGIAMVFTGKRSFRH